MSCVVAGPGRAAQPKSGARLVRAGLGAATLAGAALAAGVAAPASAELATYTLDPEHVTVAFLVAHADYAKVLGEFLDVRGTYRYDEATGELADVAIVVTTASVTTHHEERDEHLRSRDFLDSKAYPEMRFTAAGAARTGERTFEIDGNLELRGETRPLHLSAVVNKRGEYPFGRAYVMGVSARGRFERSAFGIDYGVANGWVGNEVEIIVEFEARRE